MSAPQIRGIQDSSLLVSCSFLSKCKNKDKCKHAHSKEELEAWKDAVIQQTRPFQSNFQLKLCSFGTKPYCHGLSCMFAHSKEELESWKSVGLDCRESSGKILKLCRFRERCSNGEKCKYAHHMTELEAWKSDLSVPTLIDIMSFSLLNGKKVNLPREIGAKYFKFGIHLLEDRTGARIGALEKELGKNSEDINCRIFREWLSEGGSWSILVSVLEDIGLKKLAKSIRDVKL